MPDPPPPAGTAVHVERGVDRATLTFHAPGSSAKRDLPGAGFLLIWLAAWAGAIALLTMNLLQGGGAVALAPVIFLVVWTLAGLGALMQLKKKVVPVGPETVTLDRFTFRHHLGPRLVTGPGRVRVREIELDRTDLQVQRNAAAGRLEYAHETGQVQIAPGLSPEDQQYTLALIEQWMSQGDV